MDSSSSPWALKQGYVLMVAATLTASSMAAAILYRIYNHLLCSKHKSAPAVVSSTSWPPSPRGALPVLGHLHFLKSKPHIDMYELSLKYGPLYHLRLGSTHTIVVSSASMAKEVLKTHDRCFASRIRRGAAVEILSHQYQDLVCAPYGSHWRHLRKICLLELFTSKRIESFAHLRDEETSLLVKNFLDNSLTGKPVTMNLKFTQTTLNIITLMTMGKRLIRSSTSSEQGESDEAELRSFRKTINELFVLAGIINNLGDYFPSIRWLDLQGYERRMRKCSKSFDDFVLGMIKTKRAAKKQSESEQKDLLDLLLSLPNEESGKLSDDIVTATMMNILSAGVDTSSSTVEWAFAELARKPEMMKKAQDEIDARVGKARRVEEADLPHLPYLEAVVKETLRLHPPAPLLIPHESIEACQLQGYYIPAGTRLYVNAWAIGRDPSVWDMPMEFYPERFLGKDIDVKGHNFELIPFGSGRRMCPGILLGLVVIQLTLSRLLHSFDFSLPSSQRADNLDMSESFGLTVFKTIPLQLMAKARLPSMGVYCG